MSKPILPRYATDVGVTVEPSEPKKDTGWLAQEKPPFQFFNWLHHQSFLSHLYLTSRVDREQRHLVLSATPIVWTGADVTFASDIDIRFREGELERRNSIATADSPLSLADGEVIVINKDTTGDGALSFQATYANLVAGEYAIVADASLLPANEENELIFMRRRGTTLEVLNQQVLNSGNSLKGGYIVTHAHTSASDGGQLDHDNLGGLGDDDHPQYSLADGSRDFTGVVIGVDPVADQDLATKIYVDTTLISDHGALTGLADDDHPQYGLIGSAETVTGDWHFNTVSPRFSVDSAAAPDLDRVFSDVIPKFWCNVSSGGTLNNDFNVSATVRNALGDYTVTIDTDLSGTTYAIAGNVLTGGTDADEYLTFSNLAVGSFDVRIENSTSGVEDEDFSLVGIGDV